MTESKKETKKLLNKYLNDASSREEFDELMDVIRRGESDESFYRLLKEEWDVGAKQPSRVIAYRRYSAAIVILLLITTSIILWKNGGEVSVTPAIQEDNLIVSGITSIKLPDGSVVTLRDGSRLNMDNSFEGDSREVSLHGEAFFNVVSDPHKPFIIHTGTVKTTVLGTSFSIKANPADPKITVTVSQGMVKVEDENILLAMLEADKQLVYDTGSNRVTEKTVDAGVELNWRSHDVIYRNSSFEQIVEELSAIYEVTILFEDDVLKERQITASLDDRDGIETILDILCTAQRANYERRGEVYVIKLREE